MKKNMFEINNSENNKLVITPQIIFLFGVILYSTTVFLLKFDEVGNIINEQTLEFCTKLTLISLLSYLIQSIFLSHHKFSFRTHNSILNNLFFSSIAIIISTVTILYVFFNIDPYAANTNNFFPSILKNFLRFSCQICLTICAFYEINKKNFLLYFLPALSLIFYQAMLGDRTGIILGLLSFISLKSFLTKIPMKKVFFFGFFVLLVYLIGKPLHSAIVENNFGALKIDLRTFETISFPTWVNAHYNSNCVIPVFPNFLKSFNSINQARCFPYVQYGLASNFWLDVFLTSGFFGIFLIQITIYICLNFFLRIARVNIFFAISFFSFFPYVTFYISRNDLYNVFSFFIQFCITFGCLVLYYKVYSYLKDQYVRAK